jgi:hypothetical protein
VAVKDTTYLYPYGGGGGGHKGTGATPFYERITDDQLQRICDCIVSGVPRLAAFKKHVAVSKSTLDRATRAGMAALKKWENGEGIEPETGLLSDPLEAAAMRFYVILDRAIAGKVEALTHRALCNHIMVRGLDGVDRPADPNGARQAITMLARHGSYQERDEVEEEEEEAPTDTEPTEADEEAFARAYLAKKGLPWPDAPGGYDPTSAAPANATK